MNTITNTVPSIVDASTFDPEIITMSRLVASVPLEAVKFFTEHLYAYILSLDQRRVSSQELSWTLTAGVKDAFKQYAPPAIRSHVHKTWWQFIILDVSNTVCRPVDMKLRMHPDRVNVEGLRGNTVVGKPLAFFSPQFLVDLTQTLLLELTVLQALNSSDTIHQSSLTDHILTVLQEELVKEFDPVGDAQKVQVIMLACVVAHEVVKQVCEYI